MRINAGYLAPCYSYGDNIVKESAATAKPTMGTKSKAALKEDWDDYWGKIDDIIRETFNDPKLENRKDKWTVAYERVYELLKAAEENRETITATTKKRFSGDDFNELSFNWEEIIDEGLFPYEGEYRRLAHYYDDILSHVLLIGPADY